MNFVLFFQVCGRLVISTCRILDLIGVLMSLDQDEFNEETTAMLVPFVHNSQSLTYSLIIIIQLFMY